jgi:hypothetical protein
VQFCLKCFTVARLALIMASASWFWSNQLIVQSASGLFVLTLYQQFSVPVIGCSNKTYTNKCLDHSHLTNVLPEFVTVMGIFSPTLNKRTTNIRIATRPMINPLKPSCNFTYHQGLTLKNSTWCPHCVYVFCTDLRTNSNFCLITH